MIKRTYLDSGVLLAAFNGKSDIYKQAMQILDDPNRNLLVSDAVWLEVMPKPLYEKRRQEVEFYETVFAAAERLSWNISSLDHAVGLAQKYGVAAMDAIHIAHAIDAKADEFVTSEKPSKPIFRVRELSMRSIQSDITCG
jgi:predicted nucleic acid-binding protein